MIVRFGVSILLTLFRNVFVVSLCGLLGLAGHCLAHDEVATCIDVDTWTLVVSQYVLVAAL